MGAKQGNYLIAYSPQLLDLGTLTLLSVTTVLLSSMSWLWVPGAGLDFDLLLQL